MARHQEDSVRIEIRDGASGVFSKGEWQDGWVGLLSSLDKDKSYEVTWKGEGEDMGVDESLLPIAVPVTPDLGVVGE